MLAMRGRFLIVVVLVAAVGLASCGSQVQHHAVQTQSTQVSNGLFGKLHWLVAASGLRKIAAVAGQGYVRKYFDTPNTTIIAPSVVPKELEGWTAGYAADVKSLAGFNSVADARGSHRFVLFDPEHWAYTPLAEQANPLSTASAVAAKAQALGVNVISAPAVDLSKVVAPGSDIWDGYLSSGIVTAYAKYATGIDIQAQGLEGRPSVYSSFVSRAAAEARQANPDVLVYAGISTNPSGQQVSAATIVQDIEATQGFVYGYWLNVPSGGEACPRCGIAQPQVAVAVVNRLVALSG